MSAIISDCGKYRYLLSRHGDLLAHQKHILFVMLNPSKADASINDPTITRCLGFTNAWGYKILNVINLYAYRATKPKELWNAKDPVGPLNDDYIRNALVSHADVVCAWGNNALENRVLEFAELAKESGARFWHLGLTTKGHPWHPLFVRADKPLERWDEMEAMG